MFFAPGGYSSAFFNSLEKDKKAPVVLGAGCLKLRPLEKDKFKTVHSLYKTSEEAVSFEFVRKPGWFIRSLNTELVIERHSKNAEYLKDSSFFPLYDLWFPDFVSFESVQKAGYYLRMKDGRLYLHHYDGTREFKEEASFNMGSKARILCYSSDGLDNTFRKKLKFTDSESRCGSECICSECCSVVSFQIYEDSGHSCEDCTREDGSANPRRITCLYR